MLLLKIFGFIFTYLGSSIIIFLFITKLMHIEDVNKPNLFIYSLGIGPITISLILTRALQLFPGHSDTFYILIIIVIFLLLLIYSRNKITLLKELKIFFNIKRILVETSVIEKILILIILLIIMSIFFQTIIFPVVENDALQYLKVAQMIHKYKTVDFYPVIKPDPETGFYATSSHPLGYISLILWNYMIQGSETPCFHKFISSFYLICTILLLFTLYNHHSVKRRYFYGISAVLILITTPVYYREAVYMGVDTFRIYMFFLSFVWISTLIKRSISTANYLYLKIFTGFVVGLGMFTHSIGILIPVFFTILYFIFSKENKKQLFSTILIIGAVAMLTGGSRYITNFVTFGSPVYDELPIYQVVPELFRNDWVMYTKKLITKTDIIFFGVFKGFTKPISYGLSYWFFLLSILISFKAIKRSFLLSFFLSVILTFYMLIIVLVVIGVTKGNFIALESIASDRYIQTIQPFVAYIGATFIGNIYNNEKN